MTCTGPLLPVEKPLPRVSAVEVLMAPFTKVNCFESRVDSRTVLSKDR